MTSKSFEVIETCKQVAGCSVFMKSLETHCFLWVNKQNQERQV